MSETFRFDNGSDFITVTTTTDSTYGNNDQWNSQWTDNIYSYPSSVAFASNQTSSGLYYTPSNMIRKDFFTRCEYNISGDVTIIKEIPLEPYHDYDKCSYCSGVKYTYGTSTEYLYVNNDYNNFYSVCKKCWNKGNDNANHILKNKDSISEVLDVIGIKMKIVRTVFDPISEQFHIITTDIA